MKALLVTNSYAHFFPDRLGLMRRLQEEGWEVAVAVPDAPSETPLPGLRLYSYPLDRKSLNPLSALRSLWGLMRICRDYKPTLIHHYTLKSILLGGWAARLSPPARTVIQHFTGLGFLFTTQGPAGVLMRALARPLFRVALRSSPRTQVGVVFQNRSDGEALERAGFIPAQTPRQLIAGTGVMLDRFVPASTPPAGPPMVLFSGRLLAHKGVHELADACRALRAQGVSFETVLMGPLDPGNPSAISEAQVRSWQEEGLLRWIGPQTDVVPWLQRASLLCLPSYSEGMARVLMEAAACGLPVVTTDAPGCGDAVLAAKTGLIVPVRNAPALTQALHALLTQPALRTQMGASARAHALREFDQKKLTEAILRFYDQCIGLKHDDLFNRVPR